MRRQLVERARARLGDLAKASGRVSIESPALAEVPSQRMTGYALALRDLCVLSEADVEGTILAGLELGRHEARQEEDG